MAWIPSPEKYLDENTSFGRFSTRPHNQNHPATVCGILDSGRLIAYSVLQAKVLAAPQANLYFLLPSIASEWDQLVEEYISKICRSFCYRRSIAKKNEVQIE
jgi:hypothetical protein